MNRGWAISSMLACVMLASTFVWAKEPKRNHPPRPHNPQPHLPNPGRNAGVVPPSTPKVNQPKVNGAKISEPKISEPAGIGSNAAHVNDATVPHIPEPKLGTAEAIRPRPGEGLARLQEMSPADQQKALDNDPEFQKLPPEQRQKLRERLEEFNKLPPAQKQQLINRIRTWAGLSDAQKEQARVLQQKLQAVPEDRQKMMRTALRSLRQMDPDERERVMNSDRFKSMFNDNERDIMRGIADLPIGKPQPEANQPAPPPQQK